MTSKFLAKQFKKLDRDINVTVNNLKTERDLEDMFYQTEKAISYVFDGKRSGTDKYFALREVVNMVDKYSKMNLKNIMNLRYDRVYIPVDTPVMRLKLRVLLFTIMRKLIFHIYFLSNVAVRFRSVS
jgi:hypothetical protein